MKILFVGMSSHIGGIESFLINTYRQFYIKGIKADFLAFENNICFEDELLKTGATIYQIPYRKNNPIGYIYGLYAFFKHHKNEYDIVHVNLNSCSSIEPIIFSKIFGYKVVAHSHNVYQSKKKITFLLNAINKRILPLLTKNFIACSTEAGKTMFGNYRFNVILNGIDVPKYKYSAILSQKLREKYHFFNKIVFGHVGGLRYQKNQKFLIKVFSEIHKKNKDTILVLVGTGPDENMLRKEVAKYSLKDDVLFYGNSNHIDRVLNMFDMIIFPSLFEGLPISVIEFQANGLICLLSDRITDQIIATNLIYKLSLSDSATEWADKALHLVKCFDKGKKGRDKYNEMVANSAFSISNECDKLLKYYLSI